MTLNEEQTINQEKGQTMQQKEVQTFNQKKDVAKQNERASLAAQYTVRQVMGFEPIGDILCKYIPELKAARDNNTIDSLNSSITMNRLQEAFHLSDQVYADMNREIAAFDKRMEKIRWEEARAFDPAVDLNDDHYLWGTDDNKERCVRSIENHYKNADGSYRTGEIVFYGPSNITQWYSLERDMLPWKGQNHGMGGCTDIDLVHYAPRLLYPFKPRVVFYQTGSNDLAEGISLTEILARKEKMYLTFMEHLPETEMIVCSGLPLPGRCEFWEATEKTNRLLQQLCNKYPRMHFLDATTAMLSGTEADDPVTKDGRHFNPKYFNMDRIHLNVEGHKIWTALMKQMLEKLHVQP